ncbi:hypothetical protein [Flexivirga alba]|uniref:Uncharacterized protein n=1 Tax=Flexivirga alba TaxID=702742 RepID=A0ABW2AH64_9MICO
MTSPSPTVDADRPQNWVRRISALVICWLIAWVFTAWLHMHPQPVGLLAALGTVFALCWWAGDRRNDWDPTNWTGDPIGRRLRTGADSRISYLRRLIDDAAVHKGDGDSNASAASVQGILRDIAVERLKLRAAESGAAQLPDDDTLITRSDPRLADYLLADPAPPTAHQTLTDIINRIEAL